MSSFTIPVTDKPWIRAHDGWYIIPKRIKRGEVAGRFGFGCNMIFGKEDDLSGEPVRDRN